MAKEKKNTYIRSIEEFNEWIRNYCKHRMIYRGLKDSGWCLSASLYRRLEISDLPKDVTGLAKATRELIEKAKKEEYHQKDGKEMENLDLLAALHHNGAATCLIDFTYNPLVALWFACQPTQNIELQNGKVVALNTESVEKFQTVTPEYRKKDIDIFLNEGQKYLWQWSLPKRDYRIITQQSVFILGKGIIEEKEIDETCFIHKDAKKNLLEELEKHGISEGFLFGDFVGFSQQNAWDQPYQDLTSSDYILRAIDTYQSNDLEKSIESCNKAILIDPQNANAYHVRGLVREEMKNHDEAIADFDRAIQINPKHEKVFHVRGITKNRKGDYDGAIADFGKVIQINPKHEEAYCFRGLTKFSKKDYDGAIPDFDKAIQINPRYERAYFSRGIAKLEKGDYGSVIIDCSKAIDINPRHALAYYYRGLINYRLKNYDEAEKDYHKAKEIAPDNSTFVPYQDKK